MDKDNNKETEECTIPVVRRKIFNFKYKWSLRKHWVGWFKRDVKRLYYSIIHGFNMGGFNGTMIPTTGKGKFVSVYSKGEIIQIKHESGYEHLEYDEIRIIPHKENHGVMVERFKNGRMCERNHMDLNQFNEDMIFASNIERLAIRSSVPQANELLPHVNTRFPKKEELENESTAYMDLVIKETDYRDRPIHLKYAFKAGVNYLNEFLNG